MKIDLQQIFTYPYDNNLLLRKQKSIRRELLARNSINYIDKRIAILGGSTTNDIKNILEFFYWNQVLSWIVNSKSDNFFKDLIAKLNWG